MTFVYHAAFNDNDLGHFATMLGARKAIRAAIVELAGKRWFWVKRLRRLKKDRDSQSFWSGEVEYAGPLNWAERATAWVEQIKVKR